MSTWGQLRLLLKQDAGTVSDDLIDGYLNTRYGDVMDRYPWKGLEVEGILQTTAAYQGGSASVTQGSAAVAGTGTTWTPAMSGLRFQALGAYAVYTFTYVSATSGTLDRNYEDESNATAGYWLFQDEYALPAATKTVLSVVSPWTGLPLEELTKGQVLAPVFRPGYPGTPEAYALAADSNENAPPVLHTLQFYPPPLVARGYPLRYQKATAGFGGTNTASAPLPFVTDNVLLCGCRADIKKKLKDYAGAQIEEQAYDRAVMTMIKLDVIRRGTAAPQTAGVFSNYRLRRVIR